MVLALFLTLALLLPARLVFAPFGAFGTPAALVGCAALALWGLSRCTPSLRAAFGPQPLRVVLWTYVGAGLLSYAVATSGFLPADFLRGADRSLLQLVAVSGVALLAMDGLRSRDHVTRLVQWLVALTAAIAGIALLEFFAGVDLSRIMTRIPGLTTTGDLALIGSRAALPRVAGTATHPIEFGVVCAIVLPLALHLARRNPRRIGPWIPVVMLSAALPTSISRSAIIALVVGSACYVLTWPVRQQLVAYACVPVLLVPGRALMPGMLGTIAKLFLRVGSDPSVSARTEDYQTVGAVVAAHPITGTGIGTFFPPHAPIIDNQFLGQLVETGVIGLVALLVLCVVAIGSARGVRRRSADPETRDLAQALLACIAGAAVTFATFDYLAFALGTAVFFVAVGAIGALWRVSGGTRAWATAGSRVASV